MFLREKNRGGACDKTDVEKAEARVFQIESYERRAIFGTGHFLLARFRCTATSRRDATVVGDRDEQLRSACTAVVSGRSERK